MFYSFSEGDEMVQRDVIRIGAAAGWIALVGIVALLIAYPVLIAGQPPTSATPTAEAMSYFRHPEFAVINAILAVFVGIVAVVPFGLGLRAVIRASNDGRAGAFADIGMALLLVALPAYVISGALGATLTVIADGDAGIFVPMFRLYELLYNGAADVLEGAWIGAFSLAGLSGAFPRWLAWLGIVVGVGRWIKAFGAVVVLPSAIGLLGGLLFVAWFLGAAVVLTRAAGQPARMGTAAVPAG
jgi:hypothetical protein